VISVVVGVLLVASSLSGCTGAAANEGTVTVLGSWVGDEQDGFMAMVRGFEREYRIRVNYTGTRDAPAVLANDLKNGDPPDLAVLATPGVMHEYAAKGELVPINGALNPQTLSSQYGSNWLQLMQATGPSGSKAYYAIIVKAALKSVIWYDPNQLPAPYVQLLSSRDLTWNEFASATKHLAGKGATPWCIGMADSSNSGWPGTDWIEDIVLHQSGPGVYDNWVNGTLPWTSAPITQAFQEFSQVAATGVVPSELSSPFDSVGKAMFTSPPGCYLDHEGPQETLGPSISGGQAQAGTRYNFIPFPPLASAGQNSIEVAGDLLGMFRPTAAAQKFIAYLTTPQAQEAWTSRSGSGAISANKDVPGSSYPDAVSGHIAEIMIGAANVRFDASDSMPATMESAFNNAVLQYLDNPVPEELHAILRGLDQVRKASYVGPGFGS
jgi:alpha-glucoside transport system substrate-binding protein